MELLLITEIVSVVLILLSTLLGLNLGLKYNKAKQTLKELGELITATSKAMDDDKLSVAEIKAILKEWQDVVEVWKRN